MIIKTNTYTILFILSFLTAFNAFAMEHQNSEKLKQTIEEMEQRIEALRQNIPEKPVIKQPLVSEEERQKSLISASKNRYALRSPGVLGINYSLEYKGKKYDQIPSTEDRGTNIERESTHTLINMVAFEYPLKTNLSFVMQMPFVSIYDDQQGQKSDLEDFGDPYLGILFQPLIEAEKRPGVIISSGFSAPMGRSPYEINTQTEFPTGDGVYSATIGINLHKRLDPTFLYGDFFYSYKFDKSNLSFKNSPTLGETGEQLEKVKPGDEFGFNAGIGYVISENIAINSAIRFTYQTPTHYFWRGRSKQKSAPSSTSRLILGTAWQVTKKRKFFMDLGIGLTNNDEDFYFKLKIPFNFIL